MIPYTSELGSPSRNRLPETTFCLDEESRTVGGVIDGLRAARQAARLILHTERYRYLIYSYRYGTELEGLIGRPDSFVFPELKRRLTEALCTDDRITGISDFTVSRTGGRVLAQFTVDTVYGETGLTAEIAGGGSTV